MADRLSHISEQIWSFKKGIPVNMKRFFPKITGVLAIFFLFCGLDTILYDLSPWSGTLYVFDFTQFIITVSGVAAVVFGVITILLWYKRNKTKENRAPLFLKWKKNIKNNLPIITGTITFYSLLRFITGLPETIWFLTNGISDAAFLKLSFKSILTLHCMLTAVFLVITVILLIVKKTDKTKQEQRPGL